MSEVKITPSGIKFVTLADIPDEWDGQYDRLVAMTHLYNYGCVIAGEACRGVYPCKGVG